MEILCFQQQVILKNVTEKNLDLSFRTAAVIFLGVVRSTDVDRRQNGGRSWTLIVMVAFSVWILLTHIWNLVLCFLKQTILDRNQTGRRLTAGNSA